MPRRLMKTNTYKFVNNILLLCKVILFEKENWNKIYISNSAKTDLIHWISNNISKK